MADLYIQAVYLLLFSLIIDRYGFNWRWFVPLAGAFLVAALLPIPEVGGWLLPAALLNAPGDRHQIIAAPMLIIFYPLHAFVSVQVMRRLPPNTNWLERLIVRGVAYMATAFVAGFICMLLLMGIFMAYFLFTGRF